MNSRQNQTYTTLSHKTMGKVNIYLAYQFEMIYNLKNIWKKSQRKTEIDFKKFKSL